MMREPLEREPRHHSQDVVSPSFRKAIHAIVRPGDIVLDVDSPGGLCAFEACRAGAARVYAFESVPGLIVPLAVENGLADRIVAVRGSPLDADVPERADVLIATPHDSCGGDLLQLVVDARH